MQLFVFDSLDLSIPAITDVNVPLLFQIENRLIHWLTSEHHFPDCSCPYIHPLDLFSAMLLTPLPDAILLEADQISQWSICVFNLHLFSYCQLYSPPLSVEWNQGL